jgi:DNA-binding NarL/FixJ family response regulator
MTEEKAKEFGVRAFLMKPFEIEDLAKTIRKVLDGK